MSSKSSASSADPPRPGPYITHAERDARERAEQTAKQLAEEKRLAQEKARKEESDLLQRIKSQVLHFQLHCYTGGRVRVGNLEWVWDAGKKLFSTPARKMREYEFIAVTQEQKLQLLALLSIHPQTPYPYPVFLLRASAVSPSAQATLGQMVVAQGLLMIQSVHNKQREVWCTYKWQPAELMFAAVPPKNSSESQQPSYKFVKKADTSSSVRIFG